MPVTEAAQRVLVGKSGGMVSRQWVYHLPQAIEVEEHESFHVRRLRVLLDEVLLITHHSSIGWGLAVVCGLCVAFLGLEAALVYYWMGQHLAAGIVLASTAPFALVGLVRIVVRVDTITIYGKRTKAQVSFWLRKGRGRETFEELGRLVREYQDRLAGEAKSFGEQPPPL
jgi:hypothetical protein